MRAINFYSVVIFFMGLILMQCQPKVKEGEENSTPSILIDNTSLLSFENLATEVAFIPLIAPTDSLINLSCNVSELVVNDKIYYASRCYKDLSIHSFDLTGKHLQSWNKKGDGPGEYPALHGFTINKNELYINTGRGTILNYELPGFEFKKTIELGEYNFVPTVSFLSSESWLISSEPPGKERQNIFHVVGSNPKVSKTLPIMSLPFSGELNAGLMTNINEGKLLNFGLSDTIYQYQNDSITAFITLNFGNKGILTDDFSLDGDAFVEKILLSQNYIFNTGQVDYSEGTLKLMVYGIEKNPNFNKGDLSTFPFYDVFIHRESGKQKTTKALMNVRNNSYSKDGYFYQVMQYEDWQRALDKAYFGKHEKKLQEAVDNLSYQEDPIILRYKVAF